MSPQVWPLLLTWRPWDTEKLWQRQSRLCKGWPGRSRSVIPSIPVFLGSQNSLPNNSLTAAICDYVANTTGEYTKYAIFHMKHNHVRFLVKQYFILRLFSTIYYWHLNSLITITTVSNYFLKIATELSLFTTYADLYSLVLLRLTGFYLFRF